MKHVILAGALAGICGLGVVTAVSSAPPARDVIQAPTATIEGCLLAGSAPGEFIVSTGRERHTVVGDQSVDLAPHVSHRVRLTGALEKGKMGEVFRVTELTMVSSSCAARQARDTG